MERTSVDIYQALKVGANVSELEANRIRKRLLGPIDNQTYFALLSFALISPKEESSLERYRELFWLFRQHDTLTVLDDRRAAIITAVCNYWNAAAEFEAELKSVLSEWRYKDWGDSCIRAASSFALLTSATRSQERFKFLKHVALKQFDTADEHEKSVLLDSCITARTGKLRPDRALRNHLRTKSSLLDLEMF
ncbi:MAG: hypothetical protein ACJAXK_001066 [Yoonia sp.]|jgi:hypothetical protein